MATYNRPLATFLADLAGNPQLLERYNRSEYDARELMTGAGLSDVQQNALLSRDVTTIHTQLLAEDSDQHSFIVPAGPVMTAETVARSRYRDFPFPVMFFEAQPSQAGGGAMAMRAAGPMPTMAAKGRKPVKRSAGAKKTRATKKTAGRRKSSSRSTRKSTSRKK